LLGTLDLMSPAGSGEDWGIPSGVPEEFSAAYWTAYEEALRTQSAREDGAHAERAGSRRSRRGRTGSRVKHGLVSGQTQAPDDATRPHRPVDDPPARDRPIATGTQRYEEQDVDARVYERVRDSVWFVPVLLLLLFLLLLLGAYVAGRRFSEHTVVQGHSAGALGTRDAQTARVSPREHMCVAPAARSL
jgi:hypothetical protein